MRIKRLSLDSWMKDKIKRDSVISEDGTYYSIHPYFFKDGVYHITEKWGKVCIFEVDGKAWVIDDDSYFGYTLNCLNASEYNKNQIAALIELIRQKIATKHQKDIVTWYRGYHSSKNAGRMCKNKMLENGSETLR